MATLDVVQIDNPSSLNLIFGQSHFIKTVEDLYEALVQSGTSLQFGIAFCEASGPKLIRTDGNSPDLIRLATAAAQKVGAGHTFFVFLDKGFPVNVLNAVKNVPEVARIFCATANDLQVIVAKTDQGRGVLGVVDGGSPLGVENDSQKEERREFLRKIGYKR